MRILHVLNALEFSGAETMIARSANDFVRCGYEVHCLSTGATEGRYASVMREAGIVVHHIPFRLAPAFWWRVVRLLRRDSFDVVHVHRERASFGFLLCARVAGARVVVRTVHSAFPYEGHARVRRRLQRRIARTLLGVRHVFVGPSVEDNERVRFGNEGETVANFVDERVFFPPRTAAESRCARKTLRLSPDAFVIGSVGSCVAVKQHEHILAALAILLRDRKVSVEYAHAGQGPLESAEQREAESLGVADAMRFLGTVRDMRQVYVACDCLVMPSRYEGLAMATLEAAACGLPVIAYDVPGLRDAVDAGATGLLVEQDPRAIADAVFSLSRDADRCRVLGRAGAERVLRMHSRSVWLRRHLLLYDGRTGSS